MKSRRLKSSPHVRAQRGIALAVVLILLVVMSLLAVVSLRGTLMEERMSAGMTDRSLGFQAAEAALREGEALAATKPVLPATGCDHGLCAAPDPAQPPRWTDESVWAQARIADVDLGAVVARPRYFVELLADDIPPRGSCTTSEDVSPDAACSGKEHRYRITARSEADGRASVMLQSHYAVP